MADRTCPRCSRPVVRIQASGPPTSATARHGPGIAYPCQCWLAPYKPVERPRTLPEPVEDFWFRVDTAGACL